jgi:hypothetical protein
MRVRAQPAAEASSSEGFPSRGLLDPLMSLPGSADCGDERTLRECPCREAKFIVFDEYGFIGVAPNLAQSNLP